MNVASDGNLCAPVFGQRILSACFLLRIERYCIKDGVNTGKGNALCSSRTSDHIASHVSPVRLDTRGQIVTHVAGSSNGIISSLAGPVVIKPRSCPGLSNFRQPQHNFPLKHSCDCNGQSLRETLRDTMEFLVFFDLVKVLPERLFLPCYSCSRNTDVNEICQ